MLRASFICLPGIGEEAEQKLWRAGCLQWGQFEAFGRPLFSQRKSQHLASAIQEAEKVLAWERPDYFLYRLSPAHQARLLGDFYNVIGYLDVETTGLSARDAITTAVFYRSGQACLFVNGYNLFDLIQHLEGCRLLVTFNGARFDVPLLKRTLRMDLLVSHLDLMPVMRACGYRGGLKAVQRQLGQKRSTGDINGRTAIDLWARFREQGDTLSLRRLLHYNAEDALALERLLVHAYTQSMSGFPIKPALPATGGPPDILPGVDRFLSQLAL